MLITAAKTAMRGTLDAAKRVVPHLIAHKVASTIADAFQCDTYSVLWMIIQM